MKKYFAAAAMVLTAVLFAAPVRPPVVRVEFFGIQGKIKLNDFHADSKLEISHPKDFKKDGPYALRAIGKTAPDGSWTAHEIRFVPDKFGEVEMSLRGTHTPGKKVVWTYYDKFEAEGTTCFNPSFEKALSGVYRQWDTYPCHLRLNFPGAPDGKNVAAATHDFPVKQKFTVRKGVPVTIRFMARSGEESDRPMDASHPSSSARHGIPSRKPASSYRYRNAKVKYLKLADKGIPRKDIKEWTPWLRPGTPPPVTIQEVNGSGSRKGVIDFELMEEEGIARTSFVRFGMPFPQGFLKATDCLKVTDPAGKAVPAQFKAISFWKDKSIKFVLIQFNANLKANEKSIWKLHTAVAPTAFKSPLKYTENADAFTVSTGRLTARISKKKFALLQDVKVDGKKAGSFSANGIELRDEQGKLHTTAGLVPEKVIVEESGPLHLVIRMDGKFSGKLASYKARMTFRANSPIVDLTLSYINTNLKNEFTDIESLKTVFIPAAPAKTIAMDGAAAARIFQHNDKKLEVDGKIVAQRISGAGTAGNISFYLRDAALRYPKAFVADQGKIVFELLPKQPDKKFGTELPYHLMFPFCEGYYRMKWGMGFSEDLRIDFSGKASPALLAAKDIVPVIDAAWVYNTRIFPGVPAGKVNNFANWDNKALQSFYAHMNEKEKNREYGFLNYGDHFGERGRNWNNNEYDLAHGLFMLFLRTGNRDVFRWARLAARHQADVDIVKAYPDPMFIGTNAQHGIGHTGVSYQREYPAAWSQSMDASFLGTNGHTWTEGMTEAWLLAGDVIPMEATLLLGEHLVTYTAPLLVRLSTHERSAGWSAIALLGIYRATGNPKYLEAAGLLIGLILDEQKFDLGGAWPHIMPSDHGGGHKNTFGNCPYLVGIVTRALREYYAVAPSPAVKKSLISGANWLSRGFSSKSVGWPYGMGYDNKYYHAPGSGLNMLISPGMMAGGRLEKNPKIYEQAKLIVDHSSMVGIRASSNSLPINLCNMPVLFEEMNRFAEENPSAGVYKFSPDAMAQTLRDGVSKELRMRGPTDKEFVVKANKAGMLEMARTRWGARPKGDPEFYFSVKDSSGKEIFADKAAVTVSKKWSIKLPGAGVYKIAIHDDWSGIWHADGKDCTVYAKVMRDYDYANASVARQYLTIPAGTRKFTIEVTGVHGGCVSFLIRPDGTLAATGDCEIANSPQLPWMKRQKIRAGVLNVDLGAPAAKAQAWKLITLTDGDVKLNIKGMTGYLSLKPVPFSE